MEPPSAATRIAATSLVLRCVLQEEPARARLETVRCLAGDLDAGFAREDRSEARADESLVIDGQDPDAHAPVFRGALRQLAALRPPAADQREVSAMLDAGRRGLAQLEADPESLKARPGSAKDPFRDFGRRTKAYGIRCGG